jgi:hypothetical protein
VPLVMHSARTIVQVLGSDAEMPRVPRHRAPLLRLGSSKGVARADDSGGGS